MERTEAAAVLGVDESANTEHAREKFRQLSAELRTKIGRAPTASLRLSYQHTLQRLTEAARVFGVDATEKADADLPATAPQRAPDEPGDQLAGGKVNPFGVEAADAAKKKSNKGKIAAAAAVVAAAGVLGAHSVVEGEMHKPDETGEGHHGSHEEHHDDPPPSPGIEDGILSAVLEELSTVDVEHLATEAAPSLDSWMVIDDPNPPELAPPEPANHVANLLDAFDAMTGAGAVEQGIHHVTIDMTGDIGTDVLNLTASPSSFESTSAAHGHDDLQLFGTDEPKHDDAGDDID